MRSISGRASKGSPRPWALALATVALAAGGCGDAASGGGPEAEPVGQSLGGSVSQLVQCSDWQGATEAEKLATIEDVRSHVNLEGTGVDAPQLSDEETMEVFENGCDEPQAQGYRLYVMYARAVAFKPLRDIAEGRIEAPSD